MRKSAARLIADNILADFIQSGDLGIGDRLPTIRTFEDKYRPVSRNTIIHALSLLENDGWINRRFGSACHVADRTPSARHSDSDSIGFVTPAGDYSRVVMRLHQGIDKVCRIQGLSLLMASSENDINAEELQVRRLIDAGCRCLVVYPVPRSRATLQNDYLATQFRDVPIVLVDLAYPEQERMRVVFDNYRAAFDVVTLLAQKGHRKIAFMSLDYDDHSLKYLSSQERREGYFDAVRYAGLPHDPSDCWRVIFKDMPTMMQSIYSQLVAWRESSDPPTALMAVDDLVAVNTISLAREMGIRVPEDLIITGFDNVELPMSMPSYITTDADFARMGEIAAWAAIGQRPQSVTTKDTYILQSPVIERSSMMSELVDLQTLGSGFMG